MSEPDELDLMIERVRTKRAIGVPLYLTCAEVFYEFADQMSDATFVALEATGRLAVEQEGPLVEPLTHQPFPESFVGFVALVAERFMAEAAAN